MLPLLLAACAIPVTPEYVALRSCRSMPGIHVDAAGQALAADAIHPDELAIWAQDRDYGVGINQIGLNGLGVIRANSICTLQSLEETSPETMHASLTRTQPDFAGLDPFEPKEVWEQGRLTRQVELELEWTDDGWRARTGLVQARADLEAARETARQGDFDGAIAQLTALEERFPDPMLHYHRLAIADIERDAADGDFSLEEDGGFVWLRNEGRLNWERPGEMFVQCGEDQRRVERPPIPPGSRVALTNDLGLEGCSFLRLVRGS